MTTSNTSQLRSFPPIEDSIDFIKQVDWEDVRRRAIAGLNNVGLVIAVIGEKTYEMGVFLARVGDIDDSTPVEMPNEPEAFIGEMPEFPSIRK